MREPRLCEEATSHLLKVPGNFATAVDREEWKL
jgi:hypothetical protein